MSAKVNVKLMPSYKSRQLFNIYYSLLSPFKEKADNSLPQFAQILIICHAFPYRNVTTQVYPHKDVFHY